MSVAEEADVPLNGSKDITLAVSVSELEHMSSSSEVICDQDIVGWGRGETGSRDIAGVYEKRTCDIYCRGGGRRDGHGRAASPPMSAKATLEVKK